MKTRSLLVLALGLALALGVTGCSSACQDLANRVCQCEAEGQVRTNCNANVKARVRAAAITQSEQDYCQQLLGTCPDPNSDVNMCAYMLQTCPGKVACGLAIAQPAPTGTTGPNDGCMNLDVPAEPAVSTP